MKPRTIVLLSYVAGACSVTAFLLIQSKLDLYYAWGRGVHPWYSPFFSFPFRLFVPAAIWVCTIFLLCRGFLKTISTRLVVVTTGGALVLIAQAFLGNPFSSRKPYEAFTAGFLDALSDRTTPNDVRIWGRDLMGKVDLAKGFLQIKERDVLPQLLNFRGEEPPDVSLNRLADGTCFLRVNYGGGFADWGIIVTEGNLPQDQHLYAVPWGPGVYGFRSR
jgi:hypothetical protein